MMFGLAHHPALYLRITQRLNGRLYRRVVADLAAASLPDGARVLDVGTGPGSLPLLLVERCPALRVDGIDLADEMIQLARARGTAAGSPVTFTTGDVAALPFHDATFDRIVSTASQHHWSDPEAGFRDILRVLRPDGEAWIYDLRLSLGRAEVAALRAAAARGVRPDGVRRESPLIGTPWYNPIGRLVVHHDSGAAPSS